MSQLQDEGRGAGTIELNKADMGLDEGIQLFLFGRDAKNDDIFGRPAIDQNQNDFDSDLQAFDWQFTRFESTGMDITHNDGWWNVSAENGL